MVFVELRCFALRKFHICSMELSPVNHFNFLRRLRLFLGPWGTTFSFCVIIYYHTGKFSTAGAVEYQNFLYCTFLYTGKAFVILCQSEMLLTCFKAFRNTVISREGENCKTTSDEDLCDIPIICTECCHYALL